MEWKKRDPCYQYRRLITHSSFLLLTFIVLSRLGWQDGPKNGLIDRPFKP